MESNYLKSKLRWQGVLYSREGWIVSLSEYQLAAGLEEDLGVYDKIFLVLDSKGKCGLKAEEKLNQFCNSEALCNSRHKIKIYSSVAIPVNNNITFVKIGDREALELKKLYNMYEFSDRVSLLFGENCVSDIWNYVEGGILTEEEAFAALMH